MTVAQALREARQHCYMYRQGRREWIVATVEPDNNWTRVSHGMPYPNAQRMVGDGRVMHALVLLGWPDDIDTYDAVTLTTGGWEDRVRQLHGRRSAL